MDRLIHLQLPRKEVFQLPNLETYPPTPFTLPQLTNFFYYTLGTKFPILVLTIYFTSVHLSNKFIRRRQIQQYLQIDPKFNPTDKTDDDLKKLPPLPFKFATTNIFKKLVLIHNIFLCVYSIWTFVSTISLIHSTSHSIIPTLFPKSSSFSQTDLFWQSICNFDKGIWSPPKGTYGLSYYAFWFYISKFYEVLDTIIILLKGRPSSLLQSYHHAGAMLSMWSGVKFISPPIWIFVVFNSFIHSIMYFYFTLSCLHIKVPNLLKKILTTMQIIQFVAGGSLLVAHLFVSFLDHNSMTFQSCVADSTQAMAIWINVGYLTPLTMLFAAFWIESYVKKSKSKTN